MTDSPTPSEAARAHCLQELALHIDDVAARHAAAAALDPSGYQTAFAATARSIASRLRGSPGYRMGDAT